jgi:hypothetical protein
MGYSLERSESATAWELRTAWAKHKPVRLVLSERCTDEDERPLGTVEGRVRRVAVTNAFVLLGDEHDELLMVPMIDVLGIGYP